MRKEREFIVDSKIIEGLKANKYPFGLMTEEMQKAILAVRHEEVQVYYHNAWVPMLGEIGLSNDWEDNAYRLRPDYAEPEVIECPVKPPNSDNMTFVDTTLLKESNADVQEMDFGMCVMHKNFTGSLSGGWLFGRLYKRKSDGEIVDRIIASHFDKYEVLPIDAVLFSNAD